MLVTIALIGLAMIALAALEIWLFWSVGDRDDRRRRRERPNAYAPTRRTSTRSAEIKLATSGRSTSMRGRSESGSTLRTETATRRHRRPAHSSPTR